MITIRAKLKRVSRSPAASFARSFADLLGNDLITILLETPFFVPTAAAKSAFGGRRGHG
jgi:hypothetical protein